MRTARSSSRAAAIAASVSAVMLLASCAQEQTAEPSLVASGEDACANITTKRTAC